MNVVQGRVVWRGLGWVGARVSRRFEGSYTIDPGATRARYDLTERCP